MKLVIDLDGVLAEFLPSMYVIVNRLWPGRIPPGYRAPDWDHTDVLTTDEVNQVFDEIAKMPDWWLGVAPMGSEILALRRWMYGHPEVDYYFVTARAPSAGGSLLHQCTIWLNQYWLSGSNVSVIPVRSGKVKVDIINALDADFSIDDSAETVRRTMERAHPRHRAFLRTQSWNENEPGEFNRVASMQEFLDKVTEAIADGKKKDEQPLSA